MKFTLKNSEIIKSTIVIQNIIRQDEKNEFKASFKAAMVLNEKSFMSIVEVLYKTIETKITEYKTEYEQLVKDFGKEIVGKTTLYGMIQLDVPVITPEDTSFVKSIEELNTKYSEILTELDELIGETADVNVTQFAIDSLPDVISYTEIDTIKYMFKQ